LILDEQLAYALLQAPQMAFPLSLLFLAPLQLQPSSNRGIRELLRGLNVASSQLDWTILSLMGSHNIF
jgi:hypothetical protein